MCIRWFTPAAKSGDPHDARRTRADPISDFAHDFVDGDLVHACRRVLDKLIPEESEVECRDHRYYVRRITPYRTDDHRIGGLVITFMDITSRKQFEQRASRERTQRCGGRRSPPGLGLTTFNSVSGAVHWSPEMKQLYGLPRDADVPVGPGEVPPQVHPEDREKVRQAWEAASVRKATDG